MGHPCQWCPAVSKLPRGPAHPLAGESPPWESLSLGPFPMRDPPQSIGPRRQTVRKDDTSRKRALLKKNCPAQRSGDAFFVSPKPFDGRSVVPGILGCASSAAPLGSRLRSERPDEGILRVLSIRVPVYWEPELIVRFDRITASVNQHVSGLPPPSQRSQERSMATWQISH